MSPRKTQSNSGEDVITIVHDPLPLEEGGFKPGARLARRTARDTLELGNFKRGTILRDRRLTYMVVGNKKYLLFWAENQKPGY